MTPDSHEAGISAPVEPFLDPLIVDGVPIIDRDPGGLEGLVLAVGMCGQGFMMGPGVANNVTS